MRLSKREEKWISRLARTNVDLITPLKLGPIISCGEFGCVFQTSDPTKVFKVSSQDSEYRVANKLLNEGLTHPALPQIYAVEMLEEPYYGLLRENIDDISWGNPGWLNEAIADFEHLSEDPESEDEFTNNGLQVLEETPGDPADELHFETFVDLAAWAYTHGIFFGDLHADNFGQRNGKLVLRDMSGVILPKRNPHPLESIMGISRITLGLERIYRLWALALVKKLIDRTNALPSSPSAKIFAMYLENYFGDPGMSIYAITNTLVLNRAVKSLGPVDGTTYQNIPVWVKDIHDTLRSMTKSYIDRHTYNKSKVDSLIRKIIGISRQLLTAAYSSPGLATQYFSDSVSQLDQFIYELNKRKNQPDWKWTIPRWAELRALCGMKQPVYKVGVLNVGEIICGYSGSPLPHFQHISPNLKHHLAEALTALLDELDPFSVVSLGTHVTAYRESEGAWATYSALCGRHAAYFLPDGRL